MKKIIAIAATLLLSACHSEIRSTGPYAVCEIRCIGLNLYEVTVSGTFDHGNRRVVEWWTYSSTIPPKIGDKVQITVLP